MDIQTILQTYCLEQGIEPFDESKQLHILRLDDLEITVGFSTHAIALSTCVAQLSKIAREDLEHLLAIPLLVTSDFLRDCPLSFAVDSASDSLWLVGARDSLEDVEDFKAMLDAYLSRRAYLLTYAKENDILGFIDEATNE